MKIFPGIEIIDLGLYINKEVLVVSDLQLGYEEALNKKGFLIPRFQKQDILNRLENLIIFLKPKIVVLNGDIKHEFSRISKSEFNSVKEIIGFLKQKAELILIKGNHDNMLEPIVKKKGITLVDYYYIEKGKTYICHGHEIQKNELIKKANAIIIGHEHPALGLRENARVEKFKCFLKGKFKSRFTKKGKNLIVLPSFNTLTEGTDILSEKLMSPFLKNIQDFEVFVVNDLFKENFKNNNNKFFPSEILYFGKMNSLIDNLH